MPWSPSAVSTASPPATGRTPVTGTPSSTGTPRATTASCSSVKSVPRWTPSAGTSPGTSSYAMRQQRPAGRGADVDAGDRPRRRAQVVEEVEPVEHLLAHVLEPDPGADRPRVVLLLDDRDVEAAVGQQAGEGRPGHAEADDRDPHGELVWRCASRISRRRSAKTTVSTSRATTTTPVTTASWPRAGTAAIGAQATSSTRPAASRTGLSSRRDQPLEDDVRQQVDRRPRRPARRGPRP